MFGGWDYYNVQKARENFGYEFYLFTIATAIVDNYENILGRGEGMEIFLLPPTQFIAHVLLMLCYTPMLK